MTISLKDIAISALVVGAALAVIVLGINDYERKECKQWQAQSKQHIIGYYLTAWQIEQCNHYGISL